MPGNEEKHHDQAQGTEEAVTGLRHRRNRERARKQVENKRRPTLI
jgi:hypothetical protein